MEEINDAKKTAFPKPVTLPTPAPAILVNTDIIENKNPKQLVNTNNTAQFQQLKDEEVLNLKKEIQKLKGANIPTTVEELEDLEIIMRSAFHKVESKKKELFCVTMNNNSITE